MKSARALFALLALLLPASLSAQTSRVVEIDLDDIVHPISSDYVRQGLHHAKESGANAVILRINTPGGLSDSMREMVEAILSSPVPIITWVGPNGARAASAGLFVLLAGDVAVMAPGTNTGAAHPVTLTGDKIEDTMEKKVVNDAAAYIRSYASRRNRNAALAEQCVIESKSVTAEEAVAAKLVDAVVNDVPAILRQFDGREVRRFNGSTVKLNLKDAAVETFSMSWRQRLLSGVLNPNLALVLGLIGLAGLYIEFTHPGLILPGVAGGICLILALFAFNMLPVNWTGAALILLAIILFVLEATVISHGILATGGIISLVVGGLMLVEGPIPQLRIRLATTLAVAIPLAFITVFLVRLVLVSHRAKSVSGEEGMVGETGIARSAVHREGTVFVHGELWSASSESPIEAGAEVRVRRVKGLKVEVEKITSGT